MKVGSVKDSSGQTSHHSCATRSYHSTMVSHASVTILKPLTDEGTLGPTQIFQEGTTEEKGENARLSAFVGAIAVGDLVKSTLGPKGMDKILQSA